MVKFHSSIEETEINIIPLINVIFVILIFFLVLYRFSTFESESLNAEDQAEENDNKLNMSGNGNITSSTDVIIIEVTGDGRVYLSGREISNSVYDFRESVKDATRTKALLSLDTDAPYSAFGKIILNLKRVGVDKIEFLEK